MIGDAHRIAPGQLVSGQYRIEGLVGEGGYGAVYAATQLHAGLTKGRRVALKVLHPDVLIRQSAIARFSREALLAQSLHHPNTVRLFDFGQTERGLPFIVYEFLDGKSLEQVLVEQVRISARRTARVATQTLKALMEAHAAGIVHRDIKPANLFLCDYAGETDFVKILDFGIAASQASDDAGPLTREGASIGTPAYMAPEQVLCEPTDGRADLYALGLVMAEALSGAPVFSGRSGMQVAMLQVADAPVPLGEHVTGSPLGEVVRRATQKKREARYASAADMLEAVERAAMGMQMHLSGPSASPATHVVLQAPGSAAVETIASIEEAPTAGMPIPTSTPRSDAGTPTARDAWGPSTSYAATPGRGMTPAPMSPSPMSPVVPTARSAGWPSAPSGPPQGASQPPSHHASAYAPTHLGAFQSPVTPWSAPNAVGGANAPSAAPTPAGPAMQAGADGPARGATLSASYLPARAAPSSKGVFVVIALGAVLLAASGAAAGVYFWLGGTTDGGRTASGSKSSHKSAKDDHEAAPKPVASDGLDGFTIRGVEAQTMLDRMVEEGWAYQSYSEGDIGVGYRITYIFEKNDVTAQLQFSPKSTVGFEMGIGYGVHDGSRSAMLTIIEDSDQEKPLMTRLLRKS